MSKKNEEQLKIFRPGANQNQELTKKERQQQELRKRRQQKEQQQKSNKRIKNKSYAMAQKQFENEKRKKEQKNTRKRDVKRVRGSSSLIRKYSVNPALERLNKLSKSNLLNVYTNRLVHWITKGWGKENIVTKIIKSGDFVNSTNKTYTTQSVKMPLVLYSMPDYLPIGWVDRERERLENVRNIYNQSNDTNLQVSFFHTLSSDNSDFSFAGNKRITRDVDIISRQYQQNEELMTNNSLKEREKQKAVGEDLFTKMRTYMWAKNIEEENDDSFWNVREFCEIVVSGGPGAETAELMEQCYKNVEQYFKILGIKAKDLYETVQDYYDGFSPIGHGEEVKNYLFRKYAPSLRSGRQIFSSNELRQGTISDDKGVPVGIDIYGEVPLFIDYSDNDLPPATFVSATTGSGKTYLLQTMIMGFLQFPDLYFPIIIDWKNEYVELARSSGMQIISSAPQDGLYFSTIEIPAATGNLAIDERAKENSLRSTEDIFEILLGEKLWNEQGVQTAVDYIRNSMYSRHHVYLDEPDTWKNSRGLVFHTFYAEISRILQDERASAMEAVDIIGKGNGNAEQVYKKIKEALAPYFEKNGSRSNFFKKAVRMEDIDRSRGVVFALDRDHERGGQDADIRLNLAMRFILHIINNLADKDDNDRRLLTIFYEETNRLLMLPKVAEIMSGLTSSGRSRGIRSFFITNAPGQVLNMGDTKRDQKFMKVDPSVIEAIIANAGSVIVGPNQINDMSLIAQQYDLKSDNQIEILELLAKQASQDNSDDSTMAHKFLIKHRGKTTLIEAISNPALDKMGMFGTETKIGSNKTEDDLNKEKDALMNELLKSDKKIQRPNSFDTKQKIIDKTEKIKNGSGGDEK